MSDTTNRESADSVLLFPEFSQLYTEAFIDYLVNPRETTLRRARRLGRKALISRLSLMQVSAIHHEAMKAVPMGGLQAPETPAANPPAAKPQAGKPQAAKHQAAESNAQATPAASFAGPHSLSPDEINPTVTAAATFFGEALRAFETDRCETAESNASLRAWNRDLRERSERVGQALCDEALQLLAAALLLLDSVGRKLAPGQRAQFDAARRILEQIDAQLTGFCNELRPKVLYDLGLPAAIEYLAQNFSKQGGIPIAVDVLMPNPLPSEMALALYQAVHEALTNVLRHSHASHVSISLREQAGVVSCSVQDDGIGFDSARALGGHRERGFGLIRIRDGARSAGGSLAINAAQGRGTELLINLWRAGQPQPVTV
jgi:signal transduction histidine kinase